MLIGALLKRSLYKVVIVIPLLMVAIAVALIAFGGRKLANPAAHADSCPEHRVTESSNFLPNSPPAASGQHFSDVVWRIKEAHYWRAFRYEPVDLIAYPKAPIRFLEALILQSS